MTKGALLMCAADRDIGAYNCTMKLADKVILQHIVSLNGNIAATFFYFTSVYLSIACIALVGMIIR